jgi:hypothetical protein
VHKHLGPEEELGLKLDRQRMTRRILIVEQVHPLGENCETFVIFVSFVADSLCSLWPIFRALRG